MAKQLVNIGSAANDGTGDPLRTAFNKINGNFDELYSQNCSCFQIGDLLYSANSAPTHGTWLVANGQYVSAVTYAALYELLGSEIVPDMQWTETSTDIASSADIVLNAVSYDGNIFVAEGVANVYYTTSDASTGEWTQRTLPNSIIIHSSTKQTHKFANNKFIIRCRSQSLANVFAYYSSSDGLTWNESVVNLPTNYSDHKFFAIEYGNNTWISLATGTSANIYSVISTNNGLNWQVKDTRIQYNFTKWPLSPRYGNGKWIFFRVDTSNTRSDLVSSTDAMTWTLTYNAIPRKFGVNDNVAKYAWGNGKWIALATNATNDPITYESTDGLTWTETNNLYAYWAADGVKTYFGFDYHPALKIWIFDAEWWNDSDYLTRVTITLNGEQWDAIGQPADAGNPLTYYVDGITTSYGNTLYQILQPSYNPSDTLLLYSGTLSYDPSLEFPLPDETYYYSTPKFIPYVKAL